jgi:transposase
MDAVALPGTCASRLAAQRRLLPVLAAVFVAEIGDVSRLPNAAALCCWAGITPRHYESDKTVRRGHIPKEGSTLVRWAAVEPCNATANPRSGRCARRSSPAAAGTPATPRRSQPVG